jgi:hypothetical protein
MNYGIALAERRAAIFGAHARKILREEAITIGWHGVGAAWAGSAAIEAQDDMVAHRKPGDIRSYRLDNARALVAEYDWHRYREAVTGYKISVAHADTDHAYTDFGPARCRNVYLLDDKRPADSADERRSRNHGLGHGVILSNAVRCRNRTHQAEPFSARPSDQADIYP